ncbi:MAG: DUF4252 domain-containing protein [Muribaculaceae bacterium]|nr:DUF4252 domain-containing protein [Muribaculaceae bacterium]
MNTLIRLIFTVLIGISAITANAGNPKKYFEDLSSSPNFDYTYISPLMLKAMGDQYLSHDRSGGLPVKSSQISYIETVYTIGDGMNEKLWKAITSIKKDNKLETLTTKKKDFYRYDVFAKLSGDQKYFTNLLVITQDGAENVSVVYMEGKIPVNTLQTSLAQ